MADWVTVFSTGDSFEAEVVKGLLESAGIRVLVFHKGLKALHPILGHAARGQVELKVAPDQAELAQSIMEAEIVDEDEHGHR